MLYLVYSTTSDTLSFVYNESIWNTVLSKTCWCFGADTVGSGLLLLMHSLCEMLTNDVKRRYLPEPFLWETFYHFVEAATAMRYNSDFEIVHRDIKTGNGKKSHIKSFVSRDNSPIKSVFLGYEDASKSFPFYPVAKLGDFGIAVMTNRDDPKNPATYKHWGTVGYKAPVSV